MHGACQLPTWEVVGTSLAHPLPLAEAGIAANEKKLFLRERIMNRFWARWAAMLGVGVGLLFASSEGSAEVEVSLATLMNRAPITPTTGIWRRP